MRTLLVLFTLVAAAFAGCVGDDAAPAEDATDVGGENKGPSKDLLDYEVDPNSSNESDLMGAHEHDMWGDLDTLKLYEGEPSTDKCNSPAGNLVLASRALQEQQEVHMGCSHWRFDDGVVVPEGTIELVVNVDATDALDHGSMELWYRNDKRALAPHDDGPVSEGEKEWTIPVASTEWDIPHAEETTWYFTLRPSGNPAVLDGMVEVTTHAKKDPDWVPILGSAHIDHWAPDADHIFVEPGRIMTIMDQVIDVDHPSYVSRSSGAEGSEAVVLDDIIAPGGTTAVAVMLKYPEVEGCPPAHAPCWVRPFLQPTGSGFTYQPTTQIEFSATHGLYVWEVPPVVPDSTYAKVSGYSLFMDIRGCPNGQDPQTGRIDGCAGDFATDLSTEVTVLMEAYHSDAFDGGNGIKSRAG